MKRAIYQWYDYLKTLTTPEQLAQARQLHRNGNGYFIDIAGQGDMGKALTALRNRAEELGYYEVADGTFRQYQPPMVATGTLL